MNKDNQLLAEAYGHVKERSQTMLYTGRPEDIHYYNDMDGRVRSIQNAVNNRGIRFMHAYVKPGKDGWYYCLEPKEDFEAALIPLQD